MQLGHQLVVQLTILMGAVILAGPHYSPGRAVRRHKHVRVRRLAIRQRVVGRKLPLLFVRQVYVLLPLFVAGSA
jgi:hypothetical protein